MALQYSTTFPITADDLARTTRLDTVFSLPADDLSRTARRDTTYAPSLDFSDVRNSMYIGLTL